MYEELQKDLSHKISTTPVHFGQPRRKRIMVVDDDIDFRLLLSELLVLEGFSVTTAQDAETGLLRLNSEFGAPDLIMLDLTMPRLDGWDFCREKLKNPETATIPVVMISGHNIPESHAKLNGVEACLTKPFDVFQIMEVVERVLCADKKRH